MKQLILTTGLAGVMFAGAAFGFFYAWICSTMWGLDAADPRVAIEAMQAMNASVRNTVFAPVFFGTPLVLGVGAALMLFQGTTKGGLWFAAAAALSLFFMVILTMQAHVPMNEALARVEVPETQIAAAQIWAEYSPGWQFWNIMRTIASGLALAFAAIGLVQAACAQPQAGPTSHALTAATAAR